MLNDIITIIKQLVGNDYLYLGESITVKLNPHTWPVKIHALSVSPANVLYVMDEFEEWYPVDPDKDMLIVPSIYQRVKMLEQQYASV